LFPTLEGPGCVTIHPFANGDCVVQNFNDKEVKITVSLKLQNKKPKRFIDGFTGKRIRSRTTNHKGTVSLDLLIPARDRVWIRHIDFTAKNN
jgi:hypothetical protein